MKTQTVASVPPPKSNTLTLHTPVQYIKGVGPAKAEILKKLGLETVEDLLYYFPREHQDRRLTPFQEIVPGKKCAIQAKIQTIEFVQVGRMLGQARALLEFQKGQIKAVWFKHLSFKYDVFAGLKRDLQPEREVFLYGLVEADGPFLQIHVEDHDLVSPDLDSTHTNGWVPLYPLTEGLQDRWFRSLLSKVVKECSLQLTDFLPVSLRTFYSLEDFPSAVQHFHFPHSATERDKARERLAFDEFFLIELALAINRQEREQNKKGFSSVLQKKLLTPFRKKLGYDFTKAQSRVINEIFRDMERSSPMNRLLQGDVGSGKTVVALSATLLAIENHHQVALLAPTEILAVQHALLIEKLFSDLPVRFRLLTGATPKKERAKILEDLALDKIDLLIGTHAILNENVQFRQLGLVIIDEQHRFGVRQRARLTLKSDSENGQTTILDQIHPDVLIMTATPIPRTLALTLYGDLDVSVIDELPAGRPSLVTRELLEKKALELAKERLSRKQQVYIVFPLVEESQKASSRAGKVIKAALQEFERLKIEFSEYSVGLLHGQMSSEEKRKTMDSFRAGDVRVLVATPVIEVGIDVPNATLMIIMNPERFGLSQLHQLRGRVGRGSQASECIIVHDNAEGGLNDRLKSFVGISDGFRLAEEDLTLRGPGEILGEAQHGIPLFRVGNLIKDGLLISQTREAAKNLIEGRHPITFKESQMLNRTLHKRFGNKINLSHVG